MASAAAGSEATAGKRRHVFLLAGQSNMAGRGSLLDTSCPSLTADLDPRIAVLELDGSWKSPAKHPLHWDKPEKVGVGPGLAFARAVLDFLPSTQQHIGLIPCAFGGSELGKWTAPDGKLFQAAVQQVRHCLSAGHVLSGILWHQGESDSGSESDAASYAERLRAVIKSFRTECEAPDVPFILGELGITFLDMEKDPRMRFARLVNQAIVEVGSDAAAHLAVASAFGLQHGGDRLHFSAAAAEEFGRRYAWKWLKLTGHVSVSLEVLVAGSLDPPTIAMETRQGTGQHLIFISHLETEACAEATLVHEGLEQIVRATSSHCAKQFETPVFLPRVNHRDARTLRKHAEDSENLIILLTPGVLSGPGRLVEILVAVLMHRRIIPVEVQRPGLRFAAPKEEFYLALRSGALLDKESLDVLQSEGFELTAVEHAIRHVFSQIALPFRPHESATIRQAQLFDIFARCAASEETNVAKPAVLD